MEQNSFVTIKYLNNNIITLIVYAFLDFFCILRQVSHVAQHVFEFAVLPGPPVSTS